MKKVLLTGTAGYNYEIDWSEILRSHINKLVNTDDKIAVLKAIVPEFDHERNTK